ncbi:hypothetical protein ACFQ3N_16430 [Virgibacillus byunsanensis]|uniref:Uncharacterized protein n=1 Tax=Virgibacillus byunsanensis TaxID=570945 RepID=A0ABW3LNI8_9BACI
MLDVFEKKTIEGLLGLSGVVVYETKKFLRVVKEEREQEKAS